jgi:hypothetical protein
MDENSIGHIDSVIAHMTVWAPWRLPLYRAVKAKTISLVEFFPGGNADPIFLGSLPAPTVAIIADDIGSPVGPDGFPCAQYLLCNWAQGLLVHSAGGETWHYDEAVRGAIIVRHLVLIETGSRDHDKWIVAAGIDPTPLAATRIPVLSIIVSPSSPPHPLPPN